MSMIVIVMMIVPGMSDGTPCGFKGLRLENDRTDHQKLHQPQQEARQDPGQKSSPEDAWNRH
jgi:hypothetical protein